MRKIIVIAGMVLFLGITFCFSQETYTITTYYPSPYGVYKTLRLFPNTDVGFAPGADCTNPGEMSYDSDTNAVLVCNGATSTWQSLGGGFWAASTDNPNNIYNINTGNVGIGTAIPDPVFKLEVRGSDSQTGILGSGGIDGVRGLGREYGVRGYSSSASHAGVYGYGQNIGVYGTGPTYGVYGYSSTGSGVYGQSLNYGVTGSGGVVGVQGFGTNLYGVAGYSDVIGVLGQGGNVGVEGYGTMYNFYAAGPGSNYLPFTGAHEVKLSADFPKNIKKGMLVSVIGETQIREDEKSGVSISSTLPTVKLSDDVNNKAVLGVLVSESPLLENHWYRSKSGERFAIINALGDGRALVTNINGDIQVGDYITTSSIAGYGQKQDDDLMHSYTLGKAIEDVDWNRVKETVDYNGKKYKAYLIAVIYTSG